MKRLAILGSTGSIGTQALDVVRQHPDELSVELLTANNNLDLLVQQAFEFQPNAVIIANKQLYPELKQRLVSQPIKVFAGAQAIEEYVQLPSVEVVLTALVGISGLAPTVSALRAGKTIALANKETLVVAGNIIKHLSVKHHAPIIPVDSEHSAIFQCLVGQEHRSVKNIILTASGGPFRGYHSLEHVTPELALAHPSWNMGKKVSIDSATLMNKGLEVIEAFHLFDVPSEHIQVLVHPESVIHSMVEFSDNSILAQIASPDMRLPIQFALLYPHRKPCQCPPMNFLTHPTLNFEQPNTILFPSLALAYRAIARNGNMPCILNAANEFAVDSFLRRQIPFSDIPRIVENMMESTPFILEPSLDDLIQTHNNVIERLSN